MVYERALSLFRRHLPNETFRPQPASDWAKGDPLPSEIAAYYAQVGPDDVELQPFAAPIFLPELRHLWTYQEHHEYRVDTWEPLETWRDGWFFLADLQNDEYGHLVFDSASSQVLKVTYSERGWISRPLFPSLATMAFTFAVLVTPVADPPTDVPAIFAQLRDILSDEELQIVLSELRWRYTPTELL